MNARLEGGRLWLFVAAAAAAAAVVFAVLQEWRGLVLFVAAFSVAALQLGRIYMRARARGTGRRH